MPGIVYRVLPRTKFDFSNLAASSTQEVVLAKGIDVSAYREASLIVRVHEINTGGTIPPSIVIEMKSDGPTAEDPSMDFVGQNALSSAVITTATAIPAGTLFVQEKTGGVGAFVRVILKATQGSSVASPWNVTLSVDISAKS